MHEKSTNDYRIKYHWSQPSHSCWQTTECGMYCGHLFVIGRNCWILVSSEWHLDLNRTETGHCCVRGAAADSMEFSVVAQILVYTSQVYKLVALPIRALLALPHGSDSSAKHSKSLKGQIFFPLAKEVSHRVPVVDVLQKRLHRIKNYNSELTNNINMT